MVVWEEREFPDMHRENEGARALGAGKGRASRQEWRGLPKSMREYSILSSG